MSIGKEYLLVCLMEECSEVIKLASKIYRFGQRDTDPNRQHAKPNHQEISAEIGDMMGVIDMLIAEGLIIDEKIVALQRSTKKLRIDEYFGRVKQP